MQTGLERRAYPRRRNKLRVHIKLVRESPDPPGQGWVADRSRGGLRLVVDREVKVGTILQVRPTSAPARARWVGVRVKNRRRRGQTIELGCRFVDTPSLVTLLLFG